MKLGRFVVNPNPSQHKDIFTLTQHTQLTATTKNNNNELFATGQCIQAECSAHRRFTVV